MTPAPDVQKPVRVYLHPGIKTEWAVLEVYFKELEKREIRSESDLTRWLVDRSELESYLEEDFAWRYIRMTSDTTREDYLHDFQFFTQSIEPPVALWSDRLNRKLIGNPFISLLEKKPYQIVYKRLKSQINLFREENIELFTEVQLKQQEFARISGNMSIVVHDQVYTMEQAATFLKNPDREIRQEVFEKIAIRRLADKQALDTLFGELVALRSTIAHNAGFSDFRAYCFEALGRFDYGPEQTAAFQQSIKIEVVPMLRSLAEKRRVALGLDRLRPWDMEVDPWSRPALKPFQHGQELIDKTIQCFTRLDPYFGQCLMAMRQGHLFDVDSRLGKAPGGYNYPLAESGAPFIFMNSAGSFRDLTTMVHEGGHAVHTFLSRHLALNDFKRLTSEVAELASMSMELLSMDHWDVFFESAADLQRAREEQLADALKTLPWVAIIDAFQDCIYTQPYSVEAMTQNWNQLYEEFGHGFCDWTGFEEYRDHLWQKQLHLFEVPFYYVEYGIAGLGAIALWKNYQENPSKTIASYIDALSKGYTESIPELYARAGIKFNMSREYIGALGRFVQSKMIS